MMPDLFPSLISPPFAAARLRAMRFGWTAEQPPANKGIVVLNLGDIDQYQPGDKALPREGCPPLGERPYPADWAQPPYYKPTEALITKLAESLKRANFDTSKAGYACLVTPFNMDEPDPTRRNANYKRAELLGLGLVKGIQEKEEAYFCTTKYHETDSYAVAAHRTFREDKGELGVGTQSKKTFHHDAHGQNTLACIIPGPNQAISGGDYLLADGMEQAKAARASAVGPEVHSGADARTGIDYSPYTLSFTKEDFMRADGSYGIPIFILNDRGHVTDYDAGSAGVMHGVTPVVPTAPNAKRYFLTIRGDYRHSLPSSRSLS